MVATEVDRPLPYHFPFRPRFSFLATDSLVLRTRGPFLERTGNFSSLKANFKLKTCWKVAQFLANKPLNFASLTDTFITSFSKLSTLKYIEYQHKKHKTALRGWNRNFSRNWPQKIKKTHHETNRQLRELLPSRLCHALTEIESFSMSLLQQKLTDHDPWTWTRLSSLCHLNQLNSIMKPLFHMMFLRKVSCGKNIQLCRSCRKKKHSLYVPFT